MASITIPSYKEIERKTKSLAALSAQNYEDSIKEYVELYDAIKKTHTGTEPLFFQVDTWRAKDRFIRQYEAITKQFGTKTEVDANGVSQSVQHVSTAEHQPVAVNQAPTVNGATSAASTAAPTANTAAPAANTAAPTATAAAPTATAAASTATAATPTATAAASTVTAAAPTATAAAPAASTATAAKSTAAPAASIAAPTVTAAAPTVTAAASTVSTVASTASTATPTASTATPAASTAASAASAATSATSAATSATSTATSAASKETSPASKETSAASTATPAASTATSATSTATSAASKETSPVSPELVASPESTAPELTKAQEFLKANVFYEISAEDNKPAKQRAQLERMVAIAKSEENSDDYTTFLLLDNAEQRASLRTVAREIEKFCIQWDKLKKKGADQAELDMALDNTVQFCTGTMTAEAYHAKATAISSKHNLATKILGGIMLGIALTAIAAGIVFFPPLAAIAAAYIGATATATAIGFGGLTGVGAVTGAFGLFGSGKKEGKKLQELQKKCVFSPNETISNDQETPAPIRNESAAACCR